MYNNPDTATIKLRVHGCANFGNRLIEFFSAGNKNPKCVSNFVAEIYPPSASTSDTNKVGNTRPDCTAVYYSRGTRPSVVDNRASHTRREA